MPEVQTPAQKSAEQKHLKSKDRSTYCGIHFKRKRFLEHNITGEEKLCTCVKCMTSFSASKDR